MPAHGAGLRFAVVLFIAAAVVVIPSSAFAQGVSAMPSNRGFSTVKEILTASCSACHDWTGSYESITAGGRIIAGDPEKSLLYQKISTDEMPLEGDKLTSDQKAFIKGWIAAGAPNSDLPISVPAAAAPAETATAAKAPGSTGFLLFPDKRTFHAVTGFTSAALFTGAGVIGVVHFLDMMNQGHVYRDQIGFQEGMPDSTRAPWVEQAWSSDSTLRWVHVGLIVSGEALYLGDAITGISMMTSRQPGRITKHDIHRWAFFTHAALMVAQIGLGLGESYALSTGQHDLVIGLGAAHAAVGVAIPAVMIGAGLENLLLPE